MTKEDDDKNKEELSVVKAKSDNAAERVIATNNEAANHEGGAKQQTAPKGGSRSSSGITRALFLAVPLMLKFAIVLVIKFLTDLVVFPLLLAYRFARLTKRKILLLFGGGVAPGNIKTTTNSSQTKSLNSLDDVNPNGASGTSGLAP